MQKACRKEKIKRYIWNYVVQKNDMLNSTINHSYVAGTPFFPPFKQIRLWMFLLAENCAIQNFSDLRELILRGWTYFVSKRSASFDYTIPWHPGSEADVQNWHPLIFVRLATWITIKETREERAWGRKKKHGRKLYLRKEIRKMKNETCNTHLHFTKIIANRNQFLHNFDDLKSKIKKYQFIKQIFMQIIKCKIHIFYVSRWLY